MENVFEILFSLLTAILAAGGFGSGIALLIQLGKVLLPGVFVDGAADNWRVAISFVLALFLFLAPRFGLGVTFEWLDELMGSLAKLGAILFPLFGWATSKFAKSFYLNALKGVSWIGISHTPDKK